MSLLVDPRYKTRPVIINVGGDDSNFEIDVRHHENSQVRVVISTIGDELHIMTSVGCVFKTKDGKPVKPFWRSEPTAICVKFEEKS